MHFRRHGLEQDRVGLALHGGEPDPQGRFIVQGVTAFEPPRLGLEPLMLQDLGRRRPLGQVLLEHPSNQVHCVGRCTPAVRRLDVLLSPHETTKFHEDFLLAYAVERTGLIEERNQRPAEELEKRHAHRPNISPCIRNVSQVRRVRQTHRPSLRRLVPRVAKLGAPGYFLRAAEVCDHYPWHALRVPLVERLHHEDIVRLQIVVYDALPMKVRHA
mmetsp:Transcript_85738/g.239727  ORF Transcript_85738/g.239727 Transcript_85738/m.239727 type:complete len:215 (-) Transcript_85738:503-1147(-)